MIWPASNSAFLKFILVELVLPRTPRFNLFAWFVQCILPCDMASLRLTVGRFLMYFLSRVIAVAPVNPQSSLVVSEGVGALHALHWILFVGWSGLG